jgi:hypothetical protein
MRMFARVMPPWFLYSVPPFTANARHGLRLVVVARHWSWVCPPHHFAGYIFAGDQSGRPRTPHKSSTLRGAQLRSIASLRCGMFDKHVFKTQLKWWRNNRTPQF